MLSGVLSMIYQVLLVLVAVYIVHFLYSKFSGRKLSGTGKVILISGCDSGFGMMLAEDLSGNEGCTVLAGCFTEAAIAKWKGRKNVIPFPLNITDEKSIEDAAKLVESTCKSSGLWGIVNNAGTLNGLLFEMTPIKSYRKLFEVNFFGHITLTQKVLPEIKRARGRIVNMASAAGVLSIPFGSAYCATKHAMVGWSHSIESEMDPYGIFVSVIQPGFMRTPFITTERLQKEIAELKKDMPPQAHKEYEWLLDKPHILNTMELLGKSAGDPKLVVNAYKDALLSSNPQRTYNVGVDAHVLPWVGMLFPWFLSYLHKKVFPVTKPKSG